MYRRCFDIAVRRSAADGPKRVAVCVVLGGMFWFVCLFVCDTEGEITKLFISKLGMEYQIQTDVIKQSDTHVATYKYTYMQAYISAYIHTYKHT